MFENINNVRSGILIANVSKTYFKGIYENNNINLYLENGKILVEIPNADGSFKTETFLKK